MKSALLFFLLSFVPAAWCGPLPACTASFQYSCLQSTAGGYYVLTPFAGTGSTEVTGYLSNGTQVFDVTIPSPPNGPGSGALETQISYAEVQVAIQSGVLTPPSGSAGGGTVITQLDLYTFVARDIPETQTLTQYSMLINVDLNGSQIFSQMLGSDAGSSEVQAAIQAADALLAGAGATFGAPNLISSSNSLIGSQVSYLETGSGEGDGFVTITENDTFGPVFLPVVCNTPGCVDAYKPFFVYAGELDITVINSIGTYIDRTVTTTDTYLTAQTYEIDGTTSIVSTPEPASLLLVGAGLAVLVLMCRHKAPSRA